MMDKKGLTTSTIIAIILGITTILLGAYILFDKTTSTNLSSEPAVENETDETSISSQKGQIQNESLPVEDTFAFYAGEDGAIILKLDNGAVYAYTKKVTENDRLLIDSGSKSNVNYTKIIDDAKRIKSFHTRSDVAPTFYVILNDGSVKMVGLDIDGTDYIKTVDMPLFNEYKVDDILSTTGEYSDEHGVTFEIKLVDGTTTKIS